MPLCDIRNCFTAYMINLSFQQGLNCVSGRYQVLFQAKIAIKETNETPGPTELLFQPGETGSGGESKLMQTVEVLQPQ